MKYCFQRAWIGLYDDVDNWRWSLSNTSFYKPGETEFRRWASGEPDNINGEQRCTIMYPPGVWGDESCEWALRPVCFDVKGENIKVTMTNFHVVLVLAPPVD